MFNLEKQYTRHIKIKRKIYLTKKNRDLFKNNYLDKRFKNL